MIELQAVRGSDEHSSTSYQSLRRLTCAGQVIMDLPAYICHVSDTAEFNELMSASPLVAEPVGVFTSLETLADVRESVKRNSLRTLTSHVFADPEPELLYSKSDGRVESWIRAVRSLSTVSFDRTIEREVLALGGRRYNEGIMRLSESKQFWKFLEAITLAQASMGVDLVLPPVPVVDGSSAAVMELAFNVNSTFTSSFEQSPLKPYGCAYYFVLDRSALKNSLFKVTLEDYMFMNQSALADSEKNPHVLFVKILGLEHLSPDEVFGLKDLIKTLNTVRKMNRLAVFLVDAGEVGLPLLCSGVDAFSERMPRPDQKGRRPYLWTGRSENVFGFVGFDSCVSLFERNGYAYPCSLPCCEHKQGVHPEQTVLESWNKECFSHFYNIRSTQLKVIRDELARGEESSIPTALVSSVKGSKYLNWIDNPYAAKRA
ncbi:MAG: hypothetical protein QW767_00370 [Thermoprotei archaeon]